MAIRRSDKQFRSQSTQSIDNYLRRRKWHKFIRFSILFLFYFRRNAINFSCFFFSVHNVRTFSFDRPKYRQYLLFSLFSWLWLVFFVQLSAIAIQTHSIVNIWCWTVSSILCQQQMENGKIFRFIKMRICFCFSICSIETCADDLHLIQIMQVNVTFYENFSCVFWCDQSPYQFSSVRYSLTLENVFVFPLTEISHCEHPSTYFCATVSLFVTRRFSLFLTVR